MIFETQVALGWEKIKTNPLLNSEKGLTFNVSFTKLFLIMKKVTCTILIFFYSSNTVIFPRTFTGSAINS